MEQAIDKERIQQIAKAVKEQNLYLAVGMDYYCDSATLYDIQVFTNRDAALAYINLQKQYGVQSVEWTVKTTKRNFIVPFMVWECSFYDDDRHLPDNQKFHDSVHLLDLSQTWSGEIDKVDKVKFSSKVTKYQVYVMADNWDEAFNKSHKLVWEFKDSENEITYT